ncbi:MAG: GxxExxY protein [Phycisphaeraceae bacterium]
MNDFLGTDFERQDGRVREVELERQDAKTPRRQEEPTQAVDALARLVIGAAIEVHKELGPGFPESVYEEALCYELTQQAIVVERQYGVPVRYKGRLCGEGRIDIFVDRQLVLELKTVEQLHPKHKAQCKAYLQATQCQLALLINFNEAVLSDGILRVVLTV